jgi:hypothetical protein
MQRFEQTANGDPAKVARLVLTVAELDDPPLRLLTGSDAYEYGRAAWRARIHTDANWEHLSRSTDHDDAGDSWLAQPRNQPPTHRRLKPRFVSYVLPVRLTACKPQPRRSCTQR